MSEYRAGPPTGVIEPSGIQSTLGKIIEFSPDYCFCAASDNNNSGVLDYSDSLILPTTDSSASTLYCFFKPNKVDIPDDFNIASLKMTFDIQAEGVETFPTGMIQLPTLSTFTNWDGSKPQTCDATGDAVWDSGKKPAREVFGQIRILNNQITQEGWQTLEIELWDAVSGLTKEKMRGGVQLFTRIVITPLTAKLHIKNIRLVVERTPPPKFTSTALIYSDMQVSAENKVPAWQGYIIQVGVE